MIYFAVYKRHKYYQLLTSRSNLRINGHNANKPNTNSPIDPNVKLHTNIL